MSSEPAMRLDTEDDRPAARPRLTLAPTHPDDGGAPLGEVPPLPGPAPQMAPLVQRVAAWRAGVVSETGAGHRRQRRNAKLTARQRIDLLLDPDSFDEVTVFGHTLRRDERGFPEPGTGGDGVVAGLGRVHDRPVAVYAQDFAVGGGTMSAANAAKVHRVQDLALRLGCPVVALNDSGGARIQDGVDALDGYAGVFRRQVDASGVVPQISVVLGPCAGGAAYSPALSDFTFMVRGISEMFVTGPDVIAAVTGVTTDRQGLGGADVHAVASGAAHFVHDDEEDCLTEVRYLLTLLPSHCDQPPPAAAPDPRAHRPAPALRTVVPADHSQPYDMHAVVDELLDTDTGMEVLADHARNLLCVLGRLDGRVVGVVANQPEVLAGSLDVLASQKGARFVRFCDAFGIPLVTLVDVPGFLPGVDQEHGGILRHGAKLLYAYCEATVPRVQVTLRKSYGGAQIVMDSRGTGNDLAFAWPTNEIAVMGADAAVDLLHRRELRAADDPAPLRARLVDQHRATSGHPLTAADRGFVDDVIDPADTRRVVARALAHLSAKHVARPARKHGTLPL